MLLSYDIIAKQLNNSGNDIYNTLMIYIKTTHLYRIVCVRSCAFTDLDTENKTNFTDANKT